MSIEMVETTSLSIEQKEAIFRMWNNEYPAQLAYDSIEDLDVYLGNLHSAYHYFAVDIVGNIVGWAFSFVRESEKWFAIIVDSTLHKTGVGTMFLNRLKEKTMLLNGWLTDHDNYIRCDGTPYISPVGFYLKNGFTLHADIRLQTDQLSAAKITWNLEGSLE